MWDVLILAGLAVSSVAAGAAPTQTAPPKKYVVNLDLPAEKRWQDVVLDNKEIVNDVHSVLK